MPERLWGAAVEAARRLGVSAVSRAAGLSYYSLKARLESVDAGRTSAPAPRFIELTVPGLAVASGGVAGGSEPELELERPDGVRLTIRHASASDLTSVVSAFLGGCSCSS